MRTYAGRNGAAQLAAENFPALGGGSSNGIGRAMSRLTAGPSSNSATRSSANTQFAAMRLAATGSGGGGGGVSNYASGSGSGPGSNSETATARVSNPSRAKLTADDFPSLGKPSAPTPATLLKKTGNRSNLYAAAHAFGRENLRTMAQPKKTLTQQFFSSSTSTSRPAAAGANLKSMNFPSLGKPSVSSTTPTPTTNGGGSNLYAAANALGRQNIQARSQRQPQNGTAPQKKTSLLGLDGFDSIDFPPPPTVQTTHPSKPQPKPQTTRLSHHRMDDVLEFPPAPTTSDPHAARAQLQTIKETIGKEKYRTLKSLTARFATNAMEPAAYVDGTVDLFDGGLSDPAFWRFVPTLIEQCPNEHGAKLAGRHLESLRRSSSGGNGGGKSKVSLISPASNSMLSFASTAAARTSSGGTTAGTLTKPKKGGVWGASTASKVAKKPSYGGIRSGGSTSSAKIAALVSTLDDGPDANGSTATKFMAKELAKEKKAKQLESERAQAGGADGKKKAKARKNELRDLAFGNL